MTSTYDSWLNAQDPGKDIPPAPDPVTVLNDVWGPGMAREAASTVPVAEMTRDLGYLAIPNAEDVARELWARGWRKEAASCEPEALASDPSPRLSPEG